jgi:hypothetical protein
MRSGGNLLIRITFNKSQKFLPKGRYSQVGVGLCPAEYSNIFIKQQRFRDQILNIEEIFRLIEPKELSLPIEGSPGGAFISGIPTVNDSPLGVIFRFRTFDFPEVVEDQDLVIVDAKGDIEECFFKIRLIGVLYLVQQNLLRSMYLLLGCGVYDPAKYGLKYVSKLLALEIVLINFTGTHRSHVSLKLLDKPI